MMYFEDARARILRHAAGLSAVLLGARSDRQAQDRRAGAERRRRVRSTATRSRCPTSGRWRPNYDFTFTPMITTRQGPLLQGEWRHRLVNGSYSDPRVRHLPARQGRVPEGRPADAGLSRLARQHRDLRPVQPDGEVDLGLGRHAAVGQDLLPGLRAATKHSDQRICCARRPTMRCPSSISSGRGDRSYFDLRTMYFFGFSTADDQRQIPIIHPVMDSRLRLQEPDPRRRSEPAQQSHQPVARHRQFRPDLAGRGEQQSVRPDHRGYRLQEHQQLPAARRARHLHARCRRDATWKTTLIDPFGQMFTPFVSLRGDVATMKIENQPGVANYIPLGETTVARLMPTVGLEYRYPLISVQPWGTADARADRATDLPPERDQRRQRCRTRTRRA